MAYGGAYGDVYTPGGPFGDPGMAGGNMPPPGSPVGPQPVRRPVPPMISNPAFNPFYQGMMGGGMPGGGQPGGGFPMGKVWPPRPPRRRPRNPWLQYGQGPEQQFFKKRGLKDFGFKPNKPRRKKRQPLSVMERKRRLMGGLLGGGGGQGPGGGPGGGNRAGQTTGGRDSRDHQSDTRW